MGSKATKAASVPFTGKSSAIAGDWEIVGTSSTTVCHYAIGSCEGEAQVESSGCLKENIGVVMLCYDLVMVNPPSGRNPVARTISTAIFGSSGASCCSFRDLIHP